MADEPAKDKGSDLRSLPQFPDEAQDLPEPADTKARRTRFRWLSAGAILGAAFGLICGIPEAFAWIRLPGQVVGFFAGLVPGMPEWVLTWVCPMIGWGVLGALAGWALDDWREERERRQRLFRD
jgi:hypothetical protein